MKLHWFQHAPFEGLGAIGDWALERGHRTTSTRFFDGELPPDLSETDFLVVMGGPMGACDEPRYPWMTGEKQAIEQAIRLGKPVLGICLGAQMIASVLGAWVRPNHFPEIGWYPVEKTEEGRAVSLLSSFPSRFDAFHWHGDTFAIPRDAIHLARSRACQNQSFLYGKNVVGLQFHLEMRETDIETLIAACRDDLTPGGLWIQDLVVMRQNMRAAGESVRLLYDLLNKLTDQPPE